MPLVRNNLHHQGLNSFIDTWFHAYLSSNQNETSLDNTDIIFNNDNNTNSVRDLAYDYGNNFDTSTGIYTVPRPGIYLFNTMVRTLNVSTGNNSFLSIFIDPEGDDTYTRWAIGQGAPAISAAANTYHVTLTIGLKVIGGQVKVNFNADTDNNFTITGGSDFTWFEGGMIAEIPV